MPLNARHLRLWFAAAAVLLIAVVAGTYFYARYRVRKAIHDFPAQLGIEIEQSTNTFTLSRSEGGHKLFDVRASKMVKYKQGSRMQLNDVDIPVYGRKSARLDHISGAQFEYDPQAHIVHAAGEVHIDLQSDMQGAAQPGEAPPQELTSSIHLKTSNLEF